MGVLQIIIGGLAGLSGDVRGALYAEPHGYGRDPHRALRLAVSRAERGRVTFVFRDLPPGRYALCLPDVEDCEGIDFEDRAVTFDGQDLVVRISAPRVA